MNSLQTATGRAYAGCSTVGLRRRAAIVSVPLACLLLLVVGSLQETIELPAARWQDRLNEADAAMRAGDIYAARALYSQTARIASWTDDWSGILAAACGLKTVEAPRDNYFATRTALVRAMIAAESRRSAAGLHEVAGAFAAIGEHNAAAAVRRRIKTAAWENSEANPRDFEFVSNRSCAG
ncbi:MAG TPA: hypothetical protein VJQ55_14935 [Candidatus Binatia bacterium]|nr:hypothetical protein [Candidatus Binatia bacterium]